MTAPNLTQPADLDGLTFSGLGEAPYLLIDFRSDSGDPRHAAWLSHQPVPVLALAEPGMRTALLDACDVVVPSLDMLASPIANIAKTPLAASILVQTLRVTAAMRVRDALVVESLAFATLQAGPEFAHWHRVRDKPEAPAQEEGPPVLLARDDDGLTIALNRASNRNAISVEMREALVDAFELAAADSSIRTVDVRGKGACFSVGGDVSEFGLRATPADAHMIRMRRLPALAMLPVSDRTTFHLHGACIGAGIELPAFAHRVCAREDAFFQLPEIRFGLIPGAGGCVSIPRRIGRQRTAYWALSARRISASVAREWGLIDAITSEK